jgi:hypothetical protein
LERIFFSELRKMGVISKIETNYRSWYYAILS